MNTGDYLTILREQDAAVDQQSPQELIEDWKKKEENFFKLVYAISVAFGGIEKIETGSLLQDANYWAEIEMTISCWEKPSGVTFVGKRHYGSPPPNMTIYSEAKAAVGGRIRIRLSNEVNFVTLIDELQALNAQQIKTITNVFEDHGLFYVPMVALEMKYDGVGRPERMESANPLGKNRFHRFFDY